MGLPSLDCSLGQRETETEEVTPKLEFYAESGLVETSNASCYFENSGN
jgi:hypothetical protein